MRRIIVLAAAALALPTLFFSAAEAQQPQNGRTITVTPRSWLDPGPVVPVGSLSNYVYAGQYLAQRPNAYGPQQDSPVPKRPWDVPGRGFSPPAAWSDY